MEHILQALGFKDYLRFCEQHELDPNQPESEEAYNEACDQLDDHLAHLSEFHRSELGDE